MITAIAKLQSIAPYSQSRRFEADKLDNESNMDKERRTWRDKCHSTPNGDVFVPPMAFKTALAECAKFLSISIPGKGKATWTKHFEAGVLCMEPLSLGVKKDQMQGEWLYCNSQGKRGGTLDVSRCFPVFPEWSGEVTFHVIDPMITEEVFEHHLNQSGKLIGIGRFRPRNGGYYGRFKVDGLTWAKAA